MRDLTYIYTYLIYININRIFTLAPEGKVSKNSKVYTGHFCPYGTQ